MFRRLRSMSMVDEIIEKILSKNLEVSRDDIINRLKMEKERTGGYIPDEILLRAIAASYGVEILTEAVKPKLLIKDLIPNLGNVTVTGRVIAVFPAQEGNKSGLKSSSLLIADRSGILRVVLWNDKKDLVNHGRINVGQILKFTHGYTKEGKKGKTELHVGARADVEVDPEDVDASDYPTIEELSVKIGAINDKFRNGKVTLVGTIKEVLPTSTFTRRDSSSGKLLRFIMMDETGEISVAVWNNRVDEVAETLKKGAKVQVVNARVKESPYRGGLEIHVDSDTYIGLCPQNAGLLKISDLKEDLREASVEGEVTVKPMVREVKTSRGEVVKLAVFEIKDETGRIWVSAWRKNAEIAAKLKAGDRVTIRNARVKRGFGNQLEVSTTSATTIKLIREM